MRWGGERRNALGGGRRNARGESEAVARDGGSGNAMERPLVLGILGSPRPKSTTGLLLARLLAGAQAEGARVEQVDLRDLDFCSCRHCRGCEASGQCVVRDDVQQLYASIRGATHLVLASPIHFSGVSGEMKSMIDRGQQLWVETYRLKRRPTPVAEPRRGVFLATCGGSDARVFGWAEHSVKAWFNCAAFTCWASLFEANTDAPPPVSERGEVLARAEALGRRLVSGQGRER